MSGSVVGWLRSAWRRLVAVVVRALDPLAIDHLTVARLSVAFGAFAGLWGTTDAMALRAEALTPGMGVWPAATYDAFFTTHGVTMLFFFATPVAFGLTTAVLPRLVGVEELAFPRIHALAFWLLPPGLFVARAPSLLDLLADVGLLGFRVRPPVVGWTLYPPMSLQPHAGIDLLLVGLSLGTLSTLLTALVVVVTVVTERTVPWARLDVFTWTMLVAAGLVVFSFPVLESAIALLLADRVLGTTFLAPPEGPMVFVNLFWFFGHPEVYVLVLPAMGVLSYLIPRFAGRDLFGKRSVVYSTLAIGVLSFGVWGHHLFASGVDPRVQASFMAVTLAVALPSAIKTFAWTTTLWNGSLRLEPPMLFCLGAVAWFVVGGVTGVLLASIPVDYAYHGTYYVVAHFHFLLVGTIVFGLVAGGYYWFPLLTGRRVDDRYARAHFWLSMVGVAVTFGALLALGLGGLPRRMATYPEVFAPMQTLATLGAFVLGVAQLLFVWGIVRALLVGDPAGDDPWGLAERGIEAREWSR
ncbi:cbb3-type cytochrome c oxidase subunit I [Halomarina oriensis]|uniref:Cytochrome-c oxidase n=1 Tax=Halomarina oriensis TaxID=671145 RepID=A0A6B0GG82_9EURY|nr:cbb3-type cytochrome c oxidase subunit I [Halomarina oriensis]MWG33027.1 cytochrome-c oxidase [Halomarina oriensis]